MQGTWRRLPVSPSLALLVGDVLKLAADGVTLQQWRGATLIATRALTFPGDVTEPEPSPVAQAINELFYFKEKHMAIATTLTGVDAGGPGGIFYLNFSDGTQLEKTKVEMEEIADALDADAALARNVLISALIRAEPDLDNADAMNGSTVSIDTAGQAPIILTRSV